VTKQVTAVADELAAETLGRWDAYAEYRDSGVDWLGETPAHWRESRLAHLGPIVGGMTPATGEAGYWGGDIPWVTPKDMKRPIIDSAEDRISERAINETGLATVEPPAVLFVVRGMILAHSFPVSVTTVPVTVNQDMKALRLLSGVEPHFVRFLLTGLASAVVSLLVEESSHGTKALRLDRWRRFALFIPPHDEQRAIVALLDREVARIDALTEKKERLIQLLDEQRLVLVHSYVLGSPLPHWRSARLKDAVIGCENGAWGDEPTGGVDDVLCVRVADFDRRTSRVSESAETMRSLSCSLRERLALRPGDLLLEKSGGGDRQPVGKVVLYDLEVPAVSSNFIARMRVAHGNDPRFLCYVHEGMYFTKVNTRSIKQSTGIQNLVSYSYLSESVMLPPEVEQIEIADELDRETARIRALIAKVRDHIALLREYRTALISAAVTGKIDVRSEVAA